MTIAMCLCRGLRTSRDTGRPISGISPREDGRQYRQALKKSRAVEGIMPIEQPSRARRRKLSRALYLLLRSVLEDDHDQLRNEINAFFLSGAVLNRDLVTKIRQKHDSISVEKLLGHGAKARDQEGVELRRLLRVVLLVLNEHGDFTLLDREWKSGTKRFITEKRNRDAEAQAKASAKMVVASIVASMQE